MLPQVFLLSPASTSGQRAALLFRPGADFSLALRLQRGEQVPLGEVFRFLSGLYFRGKWAYAQAFARPPGGQPGAWVITSTRGLVPADQPIGLSDLREFAAVPLDPAEPRYAEPLARDAACLAEQVPGGSLVLLGSIATGKYADVLLPALGDRLLFPPAFVGRGDMSRGGLLLRAVDAGEELPYVPVAGALRRGTCPGRLPRRR